MNFFRLLGIAIISILILSARYAWLHFTEPSLINSTITVWLFLNWIAISSIPLAFLYAYQPSYTRCGLWPLILVSGFIVLNHSIVPWPTEPNTAPLLAILSWALAFTLREFQPNKSARIGIICTLLISIAGLIYFSNSATESSFDLPSDCIATLNAQQPFLTMAVLGILAGLRQGKAAIPGWLMLLPSSVWLTYIHLANLTWASASLNAALLVIALAFFLLWQLIKIAPLLNNFTKPQTRMVAITATLLLFTLQQGLFFHQEYFKN